MGHKMAISAYILKIVEKDSFLRKISVVKNSLRAKEDFNCHQLFSHKYEIRKDQTDAK